MRKQLTLIGIVLIVIVSPLTFFLFDTTSGRELLGSWGVSASSVVTASQIDVVSGYSTLPSGKYLKIIYVDTQVDSYMRFDAPADAQVSDGSKLQDHLEVYVNAYPPSRYLSFTNTLAIQAKTDLTNKNILTTVGNKKTVASAWSARIPYKVRASKNGAYLGEAVELLGKNGLVSLADPNNPTSEAAKALGVWIEKLGIGLNDQYPEVVTTDTVALGYVDRNGYDRWTLLTPYDLQSYLDKWNSWVSTESSGCFWDSKWSGGWEAIYGCEDYAVMGASPGDSSIPVDHTGSDGVAVYSCDLGKSIWSKTLGSKEFWYGTTVMRIKKPNIGSDLKRECVVSSTSPTPIIDKANSFLLDLFSSSYAEKASIDSNGFTLTYPTSALGRMALVVWADATKYPSVKEVVVSVKPFISSVSLSGNSVDEESVIRLTVNVRNDGDAGDIWVSTDIKGFENMPSKKVYLSTGQATTVVFDGRAPSVTSNTNYCGKAYATATFTVPSNQLCYWSNNVIDNVIVVTPAPTQKPGTTPSPDRVDSDGDGVIDSSDDCPLAYGRADNSGCPPEDDELPPAPLPTDSPVPDDDDGMRIPRVLLPLVLGTLVLAGGMKKR